MNQKVVPLLLILLGLTIHCIAWVYPEHRGITLNAVQHLDPEHRRQLDQLWSEARIGHEPRLTVAVADVTQGVNPKQLDFASWPAISGDHSTSAENLVFNVLNTDWILGVADVAARLGDGIAKSKNRSELEGKLRTSDMQFLRVDPEYVSRAGSNNVHFMLARQQVNTALTDYFRSCCREGSAPNLVGTYSWYHNSALKKASRLATESLTPEKRVALSLAILADEAFALHFLEDGFSAGHVAGIWGNAAIRKGTHDYYDERGLEVTTWQGERLILTGDAYMRAEDREIAAVAVRKSMEQILDVIAGADKIPYPENLPLSFSPDTFNIAKASGMPQIKADSTLSSFYLPIIAITPIPALGTGLGEIPRFRSELGPFIGIAPAGVVSTASNAFGPGQDKSGAVPGLELAVHMGLGMDGVLNESGDGLVFLDLGWRLDGASTVKIKQDAGYKEFGSILSAIPSREAYYARLRLPFYLIPGDLLVLGPILLALFPKSLNKVVTTAGQGGLIPWQTGIITPAGRFQFILGREVGIYFYGAVHGADALLIPEDHSAASALDLISLRTTRIELPLLEYKPLRTFSRKQSASLLVQFYGAVDIPGKTIIKTPTPTVPLQLNSVWMFGIRLGFDWRYYYAGQKS